MQKVTFDVQTRPTNDNVGVTLVSNVTFDANGDVTSSVLMGSVTKARGVDTYTASLFTADGETELGNGFTSRSQAGHAIQRAFQADARQSKADARAQKQAQAAADKAAKAQARAEAKAKRDAEKAEQAVLKAAEKAAKAQARAEAKAQKEAEKAAAAAAKAAAAEVPAEGASE